MRRAARSILRRAPRPRRTGPTSDDLTRLRALLEQSPLVTDFFARVPAVGLSAGRWYLGAGAISGTVWNALHGFAPSEHIKDFDLVYFDGSDLSYEAEDRYIRRGAEVFADFPVEVEIRNQARVHLWYERRFGYAIEPHNSLEQAVDGWPTTATCIGVRPDAIYAPYGLDDVFDMIVRPNKKQVSQREYELKCERWSTCWPKLRIISWSDA